MSNIVIASSDPVCQSAKSWFVTKQGYLESAQTDKLKDGENLVIIAHDAELGDGKTFVKNLSQYDFPMAAKFKVILIVCSAASMKFSKDLLTPAELIANHFQRDVSAAKNIVWGTWDTTGATFTGEYILVKPDTDVTTLMSKLDIH